MTNVRNDLIGKEYGQLVITKFLGRDKHKNIQVEAKCVCGVVKSYLLPNLRRGGHTRSCGCYKIKVAGDAARTHGLSGEKHPLYLVWCAMKRRCYNKAASDYGRYGGIGVTVCDEWRNDFNAYYKWCISNGWNNGMQIDKDIIPKKLGVPAVVYSPEMCSVVTVKENNNYRRDNVVVEHEGERLTLTQLADKYNISYRLLWERHIKRKWNLERAINTPIKK